MIYGPKDSAQVSCVCVNVQRTNFQFSFGLTRKLFFMFYLAAMTNLALKLCWENRSLKQTAIICLDNTTSKESENTFHKLFLRVITKMLYRRSSVRRQTNNNIKLPRFFSWLSLANVQRVEMKFPFLVIYSIQGNPFAFLRLKSFPADVYHKKLMKYFAQRCAFFMGRLINLLRMKNIKKT